MLASVIIWEITAKIRWPTYRHSLTHSNKGDEEAVTKTETTEEEYDDNDIDEEVDDDNVDDDAFSHGRFLIWGNATTKDNLD